jgi:membrane fusion protein, multidrug efflux system
MMRQKWLFGVAGLAFIAVLLLVRGFWTTDGVAARSKDPSASAVPVEIAKVEQKKVPVKLDAIGTITPIASVAIKPRVDSSIVEVHFQDGAGVKQGDPLFTLDCRQTEADIKRVQAIIDGADAQLEQSQRDVERYTNLAERNATPIVTLNNARTSVNVSRATAESNRAQLENLKVQRDFCTIRAPISGRVSMANVKVGNFVRQADSAPMATINQMTPVYVSFTVPQKNLPDIRQAISAKTATVEAIVPGSNQRAIGEVTMIENTVDATTGMATIRATMPNADELLWPGTLVTADMTLREEKAVVVPSNAVQVSQTGNFVFTVKDGVAHIQQVTIARQLGTNSIVSAGLQGGEIVVIEGQLLLSEGKRVKPQTVKTSADKTNATPASNAL